MDKGIIKRFRSYVNENGPVPSHCPELGPCHLWMGARIAGGYGELNVRGKPERAHRLSWRINKGPIPKGLDVLHKCDNRPCVNSNHLFLGTDADNHADMMRKGRHPSQTDPERWSEWSRGNKHWTARHPEKVKRGDQSWPHLHPERMARGDRHSSKTHPELIKRGDQHHARLHPECLARGDRNGARLHPETLTRGEDHHSAKLTARKVRAIRAKTGEPLEELAERYGVTKSTISRIQLGKTWRHVV